ncbi:hypothetical protein M8J75_012702 [Diaphorina citri]|nr:hypothetical protein M8J75_012702 [Diaphorina citri]
MAPDILFPWFPVFISVFFLIGTAHAQGILLHNVTKPVGGLPNLCAPRAGDVDTASCTAFTVAQATSSCGLDVKSHSGQKYYTRYTQIKHVQCNGQTCHVDVATDAESLRAVVDCHQTAGDQASYGVFGSGTSVRNSTAVLLDLAHLCENTEGSLKNASCQAFSVTQATQVCGKVRPNYLGETFANFISVTHAQCNGQTCHTVVKTDNDKFYATVDCKTSNGSPPYCFCNMIYGIIET